MRVLIVLLIGVFVSFLPVPVYAQDADMRAAQLKTQIETVLKKQEERLEETGQQLVQRGALSIEQAGTYYAVTLPHLTLIGDNEDKIEIGMIALNAVPRDAPDLWNISVALPTPIVWRNADGVPTKKLSLGGQNASGTWSTTLENFASLQATYNGVTFENNLTAQSAVLEGLAITSSIDKEDTQTPLEVSIAAQNFKSQSGQVHTTFDRGRVTINVSDVNAQNVSVDVQQQLQNLHIRENGQDVSGLTPQDTKIHFKADNLPYKGVLDLLQTSLGSTSNKAAQQLGRLQAMILLPQLLSNAQSTLKFENTEIKNDLYSVDVDGTMAANAKAAFGLSGALTFGITGLDKIIKTMQENKETVDDKTKNQANKTIQRLTLLSALGQKDDTTDDKRTYTFEFKENGEILLNGTDFSVLMKGN